MSYQVLARKWRPRSFDEIVGQAHVVRALVNALDGDRVHHAFLFTGTRGVGKTTIARILAKCLNCETGVRSVPCGECNACREIDEGRFMDLIEVDAASRAKVDETREMMDNVQYAPSRGRYKVYLIDEVHMFSNHSFNALLKTLEEPPPHVKFLLATTDPQKLPVTVLSRCLQFNLKRLPAGEIAAHLGRILEAEGVASDPEVPRQVAAAADGSLRDALSLLDQAVAYCGGRVTAGEVQGMLGTLDRRHVEGLLNALADADAPGVMEHVERMAGEVPDFNEALGTLLSELQRIAVLQLVPGAADTLAEEDGQIAELAARFSPEDVQLYYQIGLLGRRDLPLAPDSRGAFEMVMLRMLAFRPAPEQGGTPDPRPVRASRESAASAKTAATAAGSPQPAAAKAAPTKPASAGVPCAPAPAGDADWPSVVAGMGLVGMTRELAANSVLLGKDGPVVRLQLSPAHRQLRGRNVDEKLEKALRDYYGEAIRLEFEIADVLADTPADIDKRIAHERREVAVRAIEEDPNVRALCDTFDARIDRDAIRSTDD